MNARIPTCAVTQDLARHLGAEDKSAANGRAIERKLADIRTTGGYLFDLIGNLDDADAQMLCAHIETLINPLSDRDTRDSALDDITKLVDASNAQAAAAAVDAEAREADAVAEAMGYYH